LAQGCGTFAHISALPIACGRRCIMASPRAEVARPKAPIAIVAGGIKLFVNDPEMLPSVLQSIAVPKAGGDVGALLAAAAGAVLRELSARAGRHCKSLHAAVHAMRGKLSPSLCKQVRNLNVAAAYARHVTPGTADDLLRAIAAELDASPVCCAAGLVEAFEESGCDEVRDVDVAAPGFSGDEMMADSTADSSDSRSVAAAASQTETSLTNMKVIPALKADFVEAVMEATSTDDEVRALLHQATACEAGQPGDGARIAHVEERLEALVAGVESADMAGCIHKMEGIVEALVGDLAELQRRAEGFDVQVAATRQFVSEMGNTMQDIVASAVKPVQDRVPRLVADAVSPLLDRLRSIEDQVKGCFTLGDPASVLRRLDTYEKQIENNRKQVDVAVKLGGDAWRRSAEIAERLGAIAEVAG